MKEVLDGVAKYFAKTKNASQNISANYSIKTSFSMSV
jgi:hypothetical protein